MTRSRRYDLYGFSAFVADSVYVDEGVWVKGKRLCPALSFRM